MALYNRGDLGVFYPCPYNYNHARRLRLEKLLYLDLSRSRSPSGDFKPLLGPVLRVSVTGCYRAGNTTVLYVNINTRYSGARRRVGKGGAR